MCPSASVTASSVVPRRRTSPSCEHAHALEALPVHEGPVRRAQILDRQLALRPAREPRVTARELGVVAEPPVGLGGRAPDEQLTVDREPRVGCHPSKTRRCSSAILGRPYVTGAAAASRRLGLCEGVRAAAQTRPRERGSARPAGARWRRASAAGAPQDRDGRLLRPLRLDPARRAPGSRDAAAGDRVVLRRDERGPRAPRGRHREVHRRRRHGRVRRPAVREDDALRAVRAAAEHARRARRAQRGAGPALRREAADAHRRQHRPGDRRRPRARRGLRQRGRRQRRRPPPAGGDARGDPHRRADARAGQPGRHREPVPPLELKGKSRPVRAFRLSRSTCAGGRQRG